ncbi:MAG: hypothetical protein ABWY93_22725 [Mycobacterium sp.]
MTGWRLAPVVLGRAVWDQAAAVQGGFWPVAALPARQRQVLRYLLEYHDQHGYAPSARQVADQLGLASTSGAIHHLRGLQKAGWVTRQAYAQAALGVIPPVDKRVFCDPLVMAGGG